MAEFAFPGRKSSCIRRKIGVRKCYANFQANSCGLRGSPLCEFHRRPGAGQSGAGRRARGLDGKNERVGSATGPACPAAHCGHSCRRQAGSAGPADKRSRSSNPRGPRATSSAGDRTKSMPGTEAAQTAPATSDAEAQAKAKAALEQKMSEMNKENWATPAVAPAAPAVPQTQPVTISPVKPAPPAVKPAVMSPPSQINANYPGKELGLKPIVAPPLPISAAKEARLQALLEQYKADQITPKEYHDQRAAILAEP